MTNEDYQKKLTLAEAAALAEADRRAWAEREDREAHSRGEYARELERLKAETAERQAAKLEYGERLLKQALRQISLQLRAKATAAAMLNTASEESRRVLFNVDKHIAGGEG